MSAIVDPKREDTLFFRPLSPGNSATHGITLEKKKNLADKAKKAKRRVMEPEVKQEQTDEHSLDGKCSSVVSKSAPLLIHVSSPRRLERVQN